ncbi:hypothetical protein [Streptomyces sp. NBC_00690]|uniref:hypothetical protein n=1 Tax=Streptomyces sp. NBC_00690 TaxID=2975808 RepID=UPI002E282DBD|nr:hypothetical protein [Streptomyces sp. NBC_00690]
MGTEQWTIALAALSLLVAALTAIWTVKYARAQASSAKGQLEVALQAQREQSEPYVIVDIQPHEPGSFVLVLIIQNVGPTLARNVRVTVTPELSSSAGDDITQMMQSVLSRTIPMIPPGRRLEYFFDTDKRFQSGLAMAFEFTVLADGPAGAMEPLQYTVDLSVLTEALMGERPTKRIEEHLKKIHDHVGKLTSAYKDANQLAIADTGRRQREAMRRHRALPAQADGASTE